MFRSVFFRLSGVGSRGQQPKQGSPDFPLPSHFVQLFPGDPEAFPGQPERHSRCSVLGLPRGLLPVGRDLNTSPERRPGGILTRCPSHLIWLLSTRRSSGSTPNSSRMTELLTPSLRESPATLQRKLISAACTRDLVLSTLTIRVGLPGLTGILPHHRSQLTRSVDSSAPLFTRVFKTCGRKSDDMTKSIIELRPRVSWCQAQTTVRIRPPTLKAEGGYPLVYRGELQHTGTKPGGNKYCHPCPAPLTSGNSRVEESPTPLEKTWNFSTLCTSSGSFPTREVTFYVPRASFCSPGSDCQGSRLRPLPSSHCTRPLWPLLLVVSLREGGPMSSLRAVPGRAPWIICDAAHIISNVEAKWPGSVHDARIYRESNLSNRLQRGEFDGLLLGDRGYPCQPRLLTPYPDPEPGPQQNFNRAHCRTRARVEMTIGLLKARFQCLRHLRVTPERACDIIVACVVLHNIATIRGEQHPALQIDDADEDPIHLPAIQDGRAVRDTICNNHFTV
ncbi:putative nuclease HARBI1 [Merluccius polli]|uniref:Nuclease HARBI1 n=1 Tax=Merluccius polli TaxID=89951 RepID=A0AA47MZI6_MERPO|nr:putative nuclease HARBI1 [Merluccius polli]